MLQSPVHPGSGWHHVPRDVCTNKSNRFAPTIFVHTAWPLIREAKVECASTKNFRRLKDIILQPLEVTSPFTPSALILIREITSETFFLNQASHDLDAILNEGGHGGFSCPGVAGLCPSTVCGQIDFGDRRMAFDVKYTISSRLPHDCHCKMAYIWNERGTTANDCHTTATRLPHCHCKKTRK